MMLHIAQPLRTAVCAAISVRGCPTLREVEVGRVQRARC